MKPPQHEPNGLPLTGSLRESYVKGEVEIHAHFVLWVDRNGSVSRELCAVFDGTGSIIGSGLDQRIGTVQHSAGVREQSQRRQSTLLKLWNSPLERTRSPYATPASSILSPSKSAGLM